MIELHWVVSTISMQSQLVYQPESYETSFASVYVPDAESLLVLCHHVGWHRVFLAGLELPENDDWKLIRERIAIESKAWQAGIETDK